LASAEAAASTVSWDNASEARRNKTCSCNFSFALLCSSNEPGFTELGAAKDNMVLVKQRKLAISSNENRIAIEADDFVITTSR
jgi:hypothetical protein